MRKGTLLTSFIVDEITAQARYRDHLTEAAQRRLVKLARAHRPQPSGPDMSDHKVVKRRLNQVEPVKPLR
jgi:hypothetical protein